MSLKWIFLSSNNAVDKTPGRRSTSANSIGKSKAFPLCATRTTWTYNCDYFTTLIQHTRVVKSVCSITDGCCVGIDPIQERREDNGEWFLVPEEVLVNSRDLSNYYKDKEQETKT